MSIESPSSKCSSETDQKERLSVLLAWQNIYDERITRILVFILGFFLFYFYYGVIAPTAGKNRINKLEIARSDLKTIAQQYQLLKEKYNAFAASSTSASPMGIFSDVIIPSLEDKEKESASAPDEIELKYLETLSKDMKVLSELYNKKKSKNESLTIGVNDNPNEQFRQQLTAFRRTLGSLITGNRAKSPRDQNSARQFDETSEIERENDKAAIDELNSYLVTGKFTPNKISDDPAEDLGNLEEFEGVIRHMTTLNVSPANFSLMAKIRNSVPSELRVSLALKDRGVYFGDTVTQSFVPYQNVLERYPYAIKPLEFSSNQELSSYKLIKDFLEPPFEVTTLPDLERLRDYADQLINQTTSQSQSPILNVPIINTNLDRTVILLSVPILLLALIYLINIYVGRSCGLIEEINDLGITLVSRADIVRFAPLHLFHHLNVLALAPKNIGLSVFTRISMRTSRYLNRFLMYLLLSIPLMVGAIFFYDLFSPRHALTPWPNGLIILFGLIITALMVVEAFLIIRQLGELRVSENIASHLKTGDLANSPSSPITIDEDEIAAKEIAKKIRRKR